MNLKDNFADRQGPPPVQETFKSMIPGVNRMAV
jgi:hypothetical protein